MTTMISELYDALIAGNVPEDKARKAAEALANYDDRFNVIESKLMLLQWMVGFVLVAVVIPLVKGII